jgi:hypothetical protein
MATEPRDILARSLCQSLRWAMPGPKARMHAEDQLQALQEAGLVVVPRLELSRLIGYVSLNLGPPAQDDMTARRGRKLIATLRALMNVENDDA